ncbi:rhomboid-related membrane protein [Syntrophotalea carbinolica DSM 2380]|uniref:Rhomboid-related membrane protein n=1 Tax=Syntrophotalea carbinolica (strain DSM 2380 / NBRC 103641 / GraBd1) TaxID=338963 RepID=Q3A5N4_SYNC1|nr:rhomboid family intramembrane serine protease [Syntrophotalea carbinolica]ABA88323.1 rhomboid-related membrane protein [Syntrophotalea carbinolica DSM 2380]
MDTVEKQPYLFARLHWHWRLQRWKRTLSRYVSDPRVPYNPVCVSRLLIGINLLWFTWMILRALVAGLGLGTVLNPPTGLLMYFGAQRWNPEVLVFHQWWRCLTYAYTHGGLMHLGFNMVVLYQVGPLIEDHIGSARFFILYTFTALTATLLGLLWHPLVPVVGASGSLFGLIGFAVAYFHRLGNHAHTVRNFMFQWAAIAFIFGLIMGADNAGHLGGAIGGAVFGLLLPLGKRGNKITSHLFGGLSVMAAVVTLACLLLQLIFPYPS